jgi:AraC family transcriptional regulator, transcriptional activator of pobA
MVKTGQMSSVRQMTYEPVDGSSSPVEVMSFDRLRVMNDRGTQRADFYVVAVVDSGRGSLSIDFLDYSVAPRSAVWIAPGAVHRWADIDAVAGRLVLFVPTAPVTRATQEVVATPDVASVWTVPEQEWPLLTTAVDHLQLELGAGRGVPRPGLPELLLSALVARLQPPPVEGESDDSTFRRFRSGVETHFRAHHDAGFYARTLGYSPRTLSRAVQRATGRTAKSYITDRLVLEAKRLLAHDRYSAARCAAELGFLDASSFSSFFLHNTRQRPGAWQADGAIPSPH